MQNKNQKQSPPLITTIPAYKICLTAVSTTVLTRIFTNLPEVSSTRIIKDILACQARKCEIDRSSLTISKITCDHCLPTRNIFKVMPYLIRTQGFKMAFNGIFYGISSSMGRTLIFFPIYENCKQEKFIISEALSD